MRPQEHQGCQKKRHYPPNKLMEVWCAKIEPKMQKTQKTVRKHDFFNFDSFSKFPQFWLNLGAKIQQFFL